MRASTISLLGLFALAGCSDSPGATGNPRVVYLANDTTEIRVKLVDTEPPPF